VTESLKNGQIVRWRATTREHKQKQTQTDRQTEVHGVVRGVLLAGRQPPSDNNYYSDTVDVYRKEIALTIELGKMRLIESTRYRYQKL